jgi:adenine-specific DNA-methyltransferase
MNDTHEKLKTLLRELFQFDCADLDFGIYRIMNYKREAIEKFINEGLFAAVSSDLENGILASQAEVSKELEEIKEQILKTLGAAALNGDGDLLESYHNTPLGTRYLDLREKGRFARSRAALESEIFNHLYAFFSRYYDNGDFLSKRRYGRREKYAVPYNGEEVYLHWANSDQYYIKTSEYFTDYCYKAPSGIAVHFKVRAADVEKDNVKGEKRFFVPLVKEGSYNPKTREVVLPFNYRPLTDQEQVKYGTRGQQEAISAECLEACKAHFKKEGDALSALFVDHHKRSDGSLVSFLEHHLCQYSKRNTSDFFIHKDLKGFLTRELDFYLKNEVLSLDEMEAAGEGRADGWFQIMRVIRSVGGCIIDFLAQIENFQKMLFEKKKFVIDTQYLITVGNIPEEFYPEIADNEAQWKEWKELYHIDEDQTDLFTNGKSKKERRIDYLKSNPTLPVDTIFFSVGFVEKLLALYDNFDTNVDGLLVHGENFQVLNLIQDKYSSSVKCVYIDPPYNTEQDRSQGKFLYKDNYEHSSWLSMINQTLLSLPPLLEPNSIFFASCDDNENSRLKECLSRAFGEKNFEAQIIVQSNKRGQTYKSIAKTHEYLLVYDVSENSLLNGLPRDIEDGEQDKYGLYELWELRNRNPKFGRFNRPNLYYPIFVSSEEYISTGFSFISASKTQKYSIPVYPKNSLDQDSCWRWSHKKVEAASQLGDQVLIAKQTRSGEWRIWEKSRKTIKAPKSIWTDSGVINEKGTMELGALGLKGFDFPKPIELLKTIIRIGASESDLVLDYFSGSGTTGHAIICLNREDQGSRRFILIEMGDYFNNILVPRIKKVSFSSEWKDGKPARLITNNGAEYSPKIIKIQHIERYEDSLNNIFFSDVSESLFTYSDYLIKYMLEWETKESPTLLNVEKLSRPFDYKLNITEGLETREKVVDLPETFNYLLGLHVKTRRVYHDDDRRYLVYRGTVDHREIAVIWRTTDKWEQKDFERDRDFVAKEKLTEGADEVFVNGDSYIPEAKALEPLFKSRMFGGV